MLNVLSFTITFHFSAFLSEEGTRFEYLFPSSASDLSVAVPKHENSCNNVTILLMVHALVDTLHCPKICNHLIVIAILLYCHYRMSGGESYEHVISAERDNLLNPTKCHHFSKMNQNYFIMHVLLEYSAQIMIGCHCSFSELRFFAQILVYCSSKNVQNILTGLLLASPFCHVVLPPPSLPPPPPFFFLIFFSFFKLLN